MSSTYYFNLIWDIMMENGIRETNVQNVNPKDMNIFGSHVT